MIWNMYKIKLLCNLLEFYIYSKEKVKSLKNAKLLGKILLVPILLYVFIFETIAIFCTLIGLFIQGIFIYLLKKDIKFCEAISSAFNYYKWTAIEDSIHYSFMGYDWSKPSINIEAK